MKGPHAPALALLLLSAHGATQSPDDWPRWRGASFDDTASAAGAFDGPFELEVRWKAPVGSGYSAVSVLGDVAVTLGSQGERDHVVALDAHTGELRWRHDLGPTFPGRDGANDGPVATPTLADGRVFALGARGDLVALDLVSGAKLWGVDLAETYRSPTPHWGFTTAPLVTAGLVVVQAGGPGGHAVVAFDVADGAERWSTGDDFVEYQSPVLATLHGVEQLVCSGDTDLFGVDPATGLELWRHPHGGTGFYQRIVNPLVMGEDGVFVKNLENGARMLRLGAPEDGWPLDVEWESGAVKRNYNMPVQHDGMIFSHSISLLTCIDASTGERLWRSRPPGNGWIALADGHLVVLTKEGTLHVAPAVPTGYEERAQLTLFDRTTWTPPSVAHGRIYARDNFGVAACVDVVSVERSATSARASQAHGALVDELRRKLAETDDAALVVDAFLASQERFPVIEGERVHFVHRGPEDDVVIGGDMVLGNRTVPMTRLPNSDLFVATFELPSDARVGYWFELDYDRSSADPLNPDTTTALGRGTVADLFMPARPRPEVHESRLAGSFDGFAHEVEPVRIEGLDWGGTRRIEVYLPPGYADSEARYPTIWVNDGLNARAQLGIPELLERLPDLPPTIVVFVASTSGYELARSVRTQYRELVAEQLVPEVDARFRTLAEARSRLLIGFDEGGFAALAIGLEYPHVFGKIGALSMYPGSMQCAGELERLVEDAPGLPEVHLTWGLFDSRQPENAIDVPDFNRTAFRLLQHHGATVRGGELPDGPTFGCWRERLPGLLEGLRN